MLDGCLGPIVQGVPTGWSLKLDRCHSWQYLGLHVLGESPVIIFTHQNQHFSFVKAKYLDWTLTVIIRRLVFTVIIHH
jgi:hypothetical protein